jgi:sugar O-acyltransferase (sialic acid O-acetyltransferase NeuD family)
MESPTRIVILGSSGTSLDILDTLRAVNEAVGREKYRCIGLLDDNPSLKGSTRNGVEILGPLSLAGTIDCFLINGVGSSRSFVHKEEITLRTGCPPERFVAVVHPTASVSPTAVLGRGTVVMQNAVVCSNARVGSHIVVLPCAVISHDDVIGDYTCIATGACISGNVQVGKSCYLGCNSAIIENVHIGKYCLVGMGSVVTKDVEENSVVVGNPARFLRHTRDNAV